MFLFNGHLLYSFVQITNFENVRDVQNLFLRNYQRCNICGSHQRRGIYEELAFEKQLPSLRTKVYLSY